MRFIDFGADNEFDAVVAHYPLKDYTHCRRLECRRTPLFERGKNTGERKNALCGKSHSRNAPDRRQSSRIPHVSERQFDFRAEFAFDYVGCGAAADDHMFLTKETFPGVFGIMFAEVGRPGENAHHTWMAQICDYATDIVLAFPRH